MAMARVSSGGRRGPYSPLPYLPEGFVTLSKNNRSRLNTADKNGLTALMHAARKNNVAVVDALLEMPGVDLNARSHDGRKELIEGFAACMRS